MQVEQGQLADAAVHLLPNAEGPVVLTSIGALGGAILPLFRGARWMALVVVACRSTVEFRTKTMDLCRRSRLTASQPINETGEFYFGLLRKESKGHIGSGRALPPAVLNFRSQSEAFA